MLLIIGYGNSLRGDDGIGPYIAEHLSPHQIQESQHVGEAVMILACHQLTPELADSLQHAEEVIFIDARVGETPGKISRLEYTPETRSAMESGPLTHHMTVESLLTTARDLYQVAPRAVVYSVCGEHFDFGQGFSAAVSAALPTLLSELRDLVQARLAEMNISPPTATTKRDTQQNAITHAENL